MAFKKRKRSTKAKTPDNQPKKKSSGRMKAVKKEVDGIIFASTMEADYYEYLKAEKEAGRVIKFELQPKFPLQDSFKKYGRTIKGITYISDFKVSYSDGSELIIDVKGQETDDFKLKRKMFDYKYPDLTLWLVTWDKKTACWVDYDEHQRMKRKKKAAAKKCSK
jgi:hypothetical protein